MPGDFIAGLFSDEVMAKYENMPDLPLITLKMERTLLMKSYLQRYIPQGM